MKKNKYFDIPVINEKYIYMPLHLIPESTTSVKAPWYIDELHIISQISKALPVGYYLYVKEHQSMLGERSLEFYKKVKQFPNVRLVQLNYYKDPKPWIDNALGVVTISGTTAFEAALLGKRSIVFSDVVFSLIKGVKRIHSFEELPQAIISLGMVENENSCIAYIKTIKDIGEKVDIKSMIAEADLFLERDEVPTENFIEKIEKILLLYDRGISYLQKEKIDRGN